ncbi:Lsr2 family protein [Streptomyces sp. NBC_01474]|uniref:Lsr2 family DNA-binding protein n=1 Tax=Streptomyces sp. NBC_01474 TaxID=2903880 RepID=UPI002DDB34DF|nr:histone-like nucleoid-structuring protein Lsr2 [Streptomyces sp. NBC_01474]WSD94843.1 Lsr2 family protein [Streptomyces sp. NBC_01474]
MSPLERLTELCPPPTPHQQPVDWAHVESTLGTPLPDDYERLTATYDPGCFAGYLWVYDPRHTSVHVNLVGPASNQLREQMRSDHAQGIYPAPVDPALLLPCGGTDNGERLFWVTDPQKQPDAWTIAVNEARGPRWFTFAGNLTQFLVSVLSGETMVPQFPKDLVEGGIGFEASDLDQWYPPMPSVQPPSDPERIREWGRANGFNVPLRGRIPAEVRQAWEQATEND